MIDLPHRFVPTTNKFVSPVRIVAQTGHRGHIAALTFSPCGRYIAASDTDQIIKVWCLETLDVIGSYRVGFVANQIQWNTDDAIVCSNDENSYTITFDTPSNDDDTNAENKTAARTGYIPLLGAPEFSYDDEAVTVTRNDDAFVHTLKAPIKVKMETCERYVIAINKDFAECYDTNSDKVLLSLPAKDNDAWVDFHLGIYGDYVALISQKTMWIFDPIREEPSMMTRLSAQTTITTKNDQELIAIGDFNGNITVFNAKTRTQILKTPRFARSFVDVFPSPEKAGLIAIRNESVTAFMGASQEILSSSPLPAPYMAACAGTNYTELIVACADSAIYRLKLDSNDIMRICLADTLVDKVASAADYLVLHTVDNTYRFFDNSTLRPLSIQADTPKALALNETATIAAILTSSSLILWNVRNDAPLAKFDVQNGELIAFGKDKTADSVYLITANHKVLLAKGNSLEELSTLEDPALKNGKPLSVAPAAKSYLFVLSEIDHGQFAITRVGLNSGKSSVVLKVFAAGTQIWGAAANDQSVQLRDDATCLRIVQGLTTFSVEDWSRSEPLALF